MRCVEKNKISAYQNQRNYMHKTQTNEQKPVCKREEKQPHQLDCCAQILCVKLILSMKMLLS